MALGQSGGVGGGSANTAPPPDPVTGAFGEHRAVVNLTVGQFVLTGGEASAEVTNISFGMTCSGVVTEGPAPAPGTTPAPSPAPGPAPTPAPGGGATGPGSGSGATPVPGPVPGPVEEAPPDPLAEFPTKWQTDTESSDGVWTTDDETRGI